MKLTEISLPFFLALSMPISVLASSCDAYPAGIGTVLTPTPNGPKIVSTAQISLPVNDYELVEAYREARIEAKAQISDFLSTKISKECKINTKKLSNSKMSFDSNGDVKNEIDITKNKEILCNYIESTTSYLRGVRDVGRCYKPGKFVKVTIEIKPSTFLELYKLNNY